MTVNQFVSRNILNENLIILAYSRAHDEFFDWLEGTKERNISKFFDEHTESICTIGNHTPYPPAAYLKRQYAQATVDTFCIREPWIVLFVNVSV